MRHRRVQMVDEAEGLIKEGRLEEAHCILNRVELASRYDEIGERANFLSATCLEKLDRAQEASYEYATYLAKFPAGTHSGESKASFRRLFQRFGPFDYQKIQREDPCGFAMVEKLLEKLGSESRRRHEPGLFTS